MKRKGKIIISVIVIVIIAFAALYFAFINIAGNYVVNTIVESVDDKTIEDMQSAISNIDINSPTDENTNTQPVEDEPAPRPEQADSKNNDASVANDSNKNTDTAVKPIEYGDKMDAVKMLTSKFSISEIATYKDRYFNEGASKELVSEVKQKLKDRCSQDEINKIKEWYNKYK